MDVQHTVMRVILLLVFGLLCHHLLPLRLYCADDTVWQMRVATELPYGSVTTDPAALSSGEYVIGATNGRILKARVSESSYLTVWTQTCGDISALLVRNGNVLLGDSHGSLQMLNRDLKPEKTLELGFGAITCLVSHGSSFLVGTDEGVMVAVDSDLKSAEVILTHSSPVVAIDVFENVYTVALENGRLLRRAHQNDEWSELVHSDSLIISSMKRMNDSSLVIGTNWSEVYRYVNGSDSLELLQRFKVYLPPLTRRNADHISKLIVRADRIIASGVFSYRDGDTVSIYVSRDQGVSWRRVPYPQVDAYGMIYSWPRSIDVDSVGNGVMILGHTDIDANMVLSTTNSGDTWLTDTTLISSQYTKVGTGDDAFLGFPITYQVARHGAELFGLALHKDVQTNMSLKSTGVYKSTDDGSSWSHVSTLQDVTTAFAMDDQRLFVGGQRGVLHVSTNGGRSFDDEIVIDSAVAGNSIHVVGTTTNGDVIVSTPYQRAVSGKRTIGRVYRVSGSDIVSPLQLVEKDGLTYVPSPVLVMDRLFYVSSSMKDDGTVTGATVVRQALTSSSRDTISLDSLLTATLKGSPVVLCANVNRCLITIGKKTYEVDFDGNTTLPREATNDGENLSATGAPHSGMITPEFDVIVNSAVWYSQPPGSPWSKVEICGSVLGRQFRPRSVALIGQHLLYVAADPVDQVVDVQSISSVPFALVEHSAAPGYAVQKGDPLHVHNVDANSLIITDTDGRNIDCRVTKHEDSTIEIDTAPLSTGVYYVTYTSNGTVRYLRLLLQSE